MYVNFVFFVAEEGQVELQEAVKLWSKRDRELLINNWSKRKRTSSKREEGEESPKESDGDEEDEEYSTVIIGVSVLRKARCCKNLNLPNTSSFCDCRYKEEENGG